MKKALIITATHPPEGPGDTFGIYRRLGLFVRAIGEVAGEVTMLHYVPAEVAERDADEEALSRRLTEYWGVRIRALVRIRGQRVETTWNHYGAGMTSVAGQPNFSGFCGTEQVAALDDALGWNPDVVFAHRLSAMCPVLLSKRQKPPVYFDLDDVEHKVAARNAVAPPRWPGKLAYLLQVPALAWATRLGARMSERTYTCSKEDSEHLRRLRCGPAVTTLPNAVEIPGRAARTGNAPVILFLGAYGYGPNAEAAERLIARIFPLVRRQEPLARLVVAGREPEQIPSFRKRPDGVEFPGFVPDLGELYDRVRVVCCPLERGGGTRLKLIEAGAYGKAMVSTRIGAEGLDYTPGREIVIRDDDGGLAKECVRLLRDEGECGRLGEAARLRTETLYDASRIQARIASHLTGQDDRHGGRVEV